MFSIFRRKTINPLNINVLFYKDSIYSQRHGTILVTSRKHGIKNKVVEFSILGTNTAPALTPGLMDFIFEEARKAGYTPKSLITYRNDELLADPTKTNPDKIKSNLLTWDDGEGADSHGTFLAVRDQRGNRDITLELFYRELGKDLYFTPELINTIFESVKTMGLIPLDLVSFKSRVYSPDTNSYKLWEHMPSQPLTFSRPLEDTVGHGIGNGIYPNAATWVMNNPPVVEKLGVDDNATGADSDPSPELPGHIRGVSEADSSLVDSINANQTTHQKALEEYLPDGVPTPEAETDPAADATLDIPAVVRRRGDEQFKA